MPTLKNIVPKYRKHRASGQAVVTLNGTDHYLGPHGTKASRAEYDRLIAEWLANGRQQLKLEADATLTVAELILDYWNYAQTHYLSDHKRTGELPGLKIALKVLRELYGKKPVTEFGPLALRAVQAAMVQKGWVRNSINQHLGRIKRMFKWGASLEKFPQSVYQSLATVPWIAYGRTDVAESEPVKPVSDSIMEATIEHLKPKVADVVRFIRLTGCRPSEAFSMRPIEIDRRGAVWKYNPPRHKNSRRGKGRTVMIGPKAQAVIAKYLLKEETRFVFERSGGKPFTRYSLQSSIRRVCQKHGIERWAPNQLRHAAATEIRSQFGIESASTVLGHSRLNTTELYAEKNLLQAESIAMKIG